MKEYTPQNPVFSDKFNLVERADSVNAQIHNTSVRQAMDNTVALKNQIDSYMGSTEGGKPQFVDGIKSDNVVGAVNEVFQLGGEKKAQLVENLTAMGVQASTSDTWDELLEKILDMTDTSGDTVTAPVLLTGYTAHDASGEQISGDMPEMAAVTVEAVSTTQDSEYTYLGLPEGHYSDDSKVRTKNSNLGVNFEIVETQAFRVAWNSVPSKTLSAKYTATHDCEYIIMCSIDSNDYGRVNFTSDCSGEQILKDQDATYDYNRTRIYRGRAKAGDVISASITASTNSTYGYMRLVVVVC